ncbi:MAG TPA: prolyl oligopeptidase family serine peptidase [Candidatus Baltobacteraceae bacterium]|jgi:dipeptidyl aminopeptidase/acylaminoacyl peptidase
MTRVLALLGIAFMGMSLTAIASPISSDKTAGDGWLTIASVVDFAQSRAGRNIHSDFVWNPLRPEILFSSYVGDEPWIFRYRPASGESVRVIQGSDPSVSPDGRHLAFLRETALIGGIDRETQVWVANSNGSDPLQISHIKGGIGLVGIPQNQIVWSPDSERLLFDTLVLGYALDPGGAIGGLKPTPPPQTPRVYPLPFKDTARTSVFHMIDLSTGADRVLIVGVWTGAFAWIDNDHVLIERNDKMTSSHWDCEIVSENVGTHRVKRLLSGYNQQCVDEPVLDPHGARMAFQADPGELAFLPFRRELAIKNLTSGSIKLLTHFESTLGPKAWTPDGRWLLYSRGRSLHQSLYATDGIRTIAVLSTTSRILRIAVEPHGTLIAWANLDAGDVTRLYVGTFAHNRIENIRRAAVIDDPTLGLHAGRSRAIGWRSGDGLAVDGALTLPVGYSARKRYPVVVLVHGGPGGGVWPNGEWPGGAHFIQYLAQHGYAIFQPDYRESGYEGFDQLLKLRQKRQIFQGDQDDILSGVHSLERQGIADPRHIFVLGHSYGSMEVNWLITHTSTFAAAVSYEGADVLWDYANAYGVNSIDEWRLRGTPMNHMQAYVENSAVAHAAKITTPTLFVNGELGLDAPSMPWMSAASRRMGIDSSYVLYLGEGHNLAKPANQRDLLIRTLTWLKRHNTRRGA